MGTINFPNNPTVGDEYTLSNKTWEWNGTVWKIKRDALTDAEIETAYNNQVPVVTQTETEEGTSTDIRRYNPLRIKQAIDALQIDDQNASEVSFTPNGDIAASTVQAAIQEVRDDTDTKLGSKEDTLNADQKRKITYGTAAPSGGSDGDIYLQHD